MSVHVRYETPEDLSDKIYEMIRINSNDGRIKKGSNEVTKAAERGTAQFIILAEDVNPPELLAHIPYICEEKGIPYGYVPNQEFLAKEAGLPKGVNTASIAIIEMNREASEKMAEIVDDINGIKN
jgi:large subunit ribosomal protein L7Ae